MRACFSGRHVRYELSPAEGAVVVRKVHLVDGSVDAEDSATFRTATVAEAYAAAYAAFDRYFAKLGGGIDACDLFEEWRALDDAYEDLVLVHRDAARYELPGLPAPAAAGLALH